MTAETTYITCPCRRCGDNIEFPFTSAGQIIACPHCNLETDLFIPAPSPHSAPDPASGSKPRRASLILKLAIALLGLGLLLGLGHLVASSESARQAGLTLLPAVLAVVLCLIVLLIVVGWIGFPIFLYFSLRRIEKTLAQLERNTRNR